MSATALQSRRGEVSEQTRSKRADAQRAWMGFRGVRISVPQRGGPPHRESGPRAQGFRNPSSGCLTGASSPMTRHLARLADLSYRRRGRMVVAWLVATVVIIGVGSALAGEFNADYNTPGSESKAASDLTDQRFAGYSGQEIYVVWKDEAGARSPAATTEPNAISSTIAAPRNPMPSGLLCACAA